MNGERGASFDSVNAWRASVEWRVEYIVYELNTQNSTERFFTASATFSTPRIPRI